jgi:hypothetical protein
MGKKRKDYKYPAMVPKVNLKSRQDYIDNRYYFDKLPKEAKEFLNDFNEMLDILVYNRNHMDYFAKNLNEEIISAIMATRYI